MNNLQQAKICKKCGETKPLAEFGNRGSCCKECHLNSDTYIAKLLTRDAGLSVQDIPANLIEMKREQLQLIRLTKQLKQTIKDVREGKVNTAA